MIMKKMLLLTVLMGSAGAQAQPAAGQADCLVDRAGQPDDATVVWSGACQDGFAQGSGYLQWSRNGRDSGRYEGRLVRGQMDGAGAWQAEDGAVYQGGFQQGVWQGRGIHVDKDGNKLRAMYVAGQPSGDVEQLMALGDRYQGAFAGGKRNGQGSIDYARGGSYAGGWKDDLFEGQGTIRYPNGRQYAGVFHGGLPAGSAPLAPAENHALVSRDSGSKGATAISRTGSGSPAPFDAPYGALSVEQQRTLKGYYRILLDADEPPYPAHGPGELVRAVQDLAGVTGSRGELHVEVQLDAAGTPIAALVRRAPDKELGERIAQLMMLVKYKPALCAGAPCAMSYALKLRI